MSAPDRPITTLEEVDQRLRRGFGLTGSIPVSLSTEVLPVAIVADLQKGTLGAPYGRGRRFAGRKAQTPLAAVNFATLLITAPVDLVIDGVTAVTVMDQPSITSAFYYPPGVALPFATTGFDTMWLDRARALPDRAPPVTAVGVLAAAAGQGIAYGLNGPVNTLLFLSQGGPFALMLPAGSTLACYCAFAAAASGDMYWNWMGYTL